VSENNIAFVGGGNMTRAIVGGLVQSGIPAADIRIAEPSGDTRDALGRDLPGTVVSADNDSAVRGSNCVVLAVKPQVLKGVCRALRDTVQAAKPLIVSIAAGVRVDDIEQWLGGNLAVVRVMPNQPALLRLGVSGLYANEQTSDVQRHRATEIMSAVGSVVHVATETDIDTVTAVSGSGPAYFFLLVDLLARSAQAHGLDAETARTLAIETARGAAALAAAQDEPMDELIARVRSPGGTTAAALDSLEADNVRGIFAAAITAARDRAGVLADQAHSSQ
jgi:pyrroline-5-carboxylate reductase